MKNPFLDYGPNSINTQVPLDRRDAKRAPIHDHVTYNGSDSAKLIKAEGSLKDASTTECKTLGTFLPPLGITLRTTLYGENRHASVCLADATVSWIKHSVFAVQFLTLAGEQRNRIQDVILKHIPLSHSTSRRTAFRIALQGLV